MDDTSPVEAFEIRVMIAHDAVVGASTATLMTDGDDDSIMVSVGGAKRNPSDEEDAYIGKNLALARALAQLANAVYDEVREDVED